jgi:uncharacterized membrane protein (DUF4010 family)
MISAPSVTSAALLVALSLFLGLAFEDFFARTDTRRPGGIRTFPMLALAGGVLYLFDPVHFVPFTGGLLVLGAWLVIFYRQHIGEHEETGEPNVGLVVPLLNVHAYLLGAVTLALPHWIAVGTTVAVVLLLTGREQLHALARRVDVKEIAIAGEFLILSGIILPLLPNEPVTTLTTITPHQAWLALVVVSTLSYVSYLAQRYWKAAASGLWMAALGGLYSSTATTVVLARQARAGSVTKRQAQAGITLATAIMYLRILVIVAVFNGPLARTLAIPLCGLALAGLLICALQYWFAGPVPADADAPALALPASGANPLQLGPAALFAALFWCRSSRSGSRRSSASPGSIRSPPWSALPTSILSFSIWRKGEPRGCRTACLRPRFSSPPPPTISSRPPMPPGLPADGRLPQAQPRSSFSLLPAWVSPSRPAASARRESREPDAARDGTYSDATGAACDRSVNPRIVRSANGLVALKGRRPDRALLLRRRAL